MQNTSQSTGRHTLSRTATRRTFVAGAAAAGALTAAGAVAGGPQGGLAADAGTTQASSWRTPPAELAESDIADTFEADIVIVGAGQAGNCAARAAAEAGASVLVLEKQDEDVYTVNGSEVGTINSEFATKRGVPTYEPSDFVRECLLRSMNRANAPLIKTFAENSGAHLDWFMEPLGQDFQVLTFMNPGPKYNNGECNGMRTFIGTSSFFGGADYTLTKAMLVQQDLAKKAGAEFHFGVAGERPVMDGGTCRGVIGKTADGTYQKFLAKKGVILCAGGFSANEEMVRDLLKEYSAFKGDDPIMGNGRDGSGIKIGVWAGGNVEEDPRAGTYSNQSGMAGSFGATAFLRLNSEGKRYSNEGMFGAWGQGAASLRQSGPFVCCVFDSNWREELEYQPPEHFCVDMGWSEKLVELEEAMAAIPVGPEGGDSSFSATPLPFEVAYHYWAADTVEELAGYLGFEGEAAANFVASVARYNELCEKGFDEDFGKDPLLMRPIVQPPFYGYKENKNVGNLVVTLSGLRIDSEQRVLDVGYDPIPGLYACGNNSGSRFAVQYMTPIPGFSVGLAQVLGHVLGEKLAGADDLA